jgi:L-ascorbate metabolism protein UlaG (beta-lactamase superfamily)
VFEHAEEVVVRLVKYEHACVRVESDAAVLVIDPGSFTARRALDGVDAVLITHEHADHLDVEALADALAKRPAVRVFTHPAVAGKLSALSGAVTTVSSGEEFEAAGLRVRAYGGWHALIHADVPRVPNLGFLVEGGLYHPGDSFDLPEGATVDTLFVPISAPWLKAAESVDFVRSVAPRRAFALHDHLLSAAGLPIVDSLLSRLAGTPYRRLAPGESVSL